MSIRIVVAITLLVCPLLAAAQNQLPPAYVKLVRAINFVQELRANPSRIDQEDAALATSLACEALREVNRDEELRKRVSAAAAAAADHEARNAAIRGSLNLFLNEFLSPELIILERAGLSPTSIRQILQDSRALEAQFYIGKYGKGSEEPFFKNVALVTDEICRAASQAKLILENKKSDMLFRLGVATAGVLIVAADMYLTPTPTGLLAVQSYSFGASLVTGAVLK